MGRFVVGYFLLFTFYFLLSTFHLKSEFQHRKADANEKSHQQDAAASEVEFEFQQIVPDDEHARHDAQQDEFLDEVKIQDVQRLPCDGQHQIDQSI